MTAGTAAGANVTPVWAILFLFSSRPAKLIGSCCVGVDIINENAYNYSMTTITLIDPEIASLAGEWAVNNIGYKYWTLNADNIFSKKPLYHFKFKHKKDAVLFSLKWAS
jgi:hypothetical protein